MIVYTCMCEQTLKCEYVIILMMCFGAMQLSLVFKAISSFLHNTFAVVQIMIMFEGTGLTFWFQGLW